MSGDRDSQFLRYLRASQLLDDEQLEQASRISRDAPADDRELAQRLVAAKLLTPYQAKQVLAGKVKGFVIGPYSITDHIGAGGMGRVFKAVHRDMGRTVALKVMTGARRDSPEARARFMREARAAAKLEHPNIVTIYDVRQEAGVTYIAMQFVEGEDLYQRIRQAGRLEPQEAARIASQVALALGHAQRSGIVHRDIKPANILIDRDGTAKVLDMGLARIEHDDADEKSGTLTRDGQVMGTPDYLAPEQVDDVHTVDIRADIYALGCTLYHMLAGDVPFPGGSLARKLLKHQMEDPTPLVELAPDVPAELAAAVMRMMAKRAQDRYQTPAEVAMALEPWSRPSRAGVRPAPPGVSLPTGIPALAQEPTELRQPTPVPARPARWGMRGWGRIPMWAWGGAAGGAVLLLVAVVFWPTGQPERTRRAESGPTKPVAAGSPAARPVAIAATAPVGRPREWPTAVAAGPHATVPPSATPSKASLRPGAARSGPEPRVKSPEAAPTPGPPTGARRPPTPEPERRSPMSHAELVEQIKADLKAGRYEAARQAVEQAMKLQAEDREPAKLLNAAYEAQIAIARKASKAGKYTAVAEALERGLALKPDDKTAVGMREAIARRAVREGHQLLRRKQLAQAASLATDAIRLWSDGPGSMTLGRKILAQLPQYCENRSI